MAMPRGNNLIHMNKINLFFFFPLQSRAMHAILTASHLEETAMMHFSFVRFSGYAYVGHSLAFVRA